MKRLMFLLYLTFSIVNISHSQTDETITFGFDGYRHMTVHRPIVRTVPGGGVIKLLYEGNEWQQNLERKNALEHACRIFEEQMPTPVSLLVKVSFGRIAGSTFLAKTNAKRDDEYLENRAYMKRRMLSYHEFQQVGVEFFSDIDAEIVFSDKDIFSYSLNDVTEDKYDFVTVALQQLARACGINNSIKADNTNRLLLFDENNINRFENIFMIGFTNNPSEAYNMATSGNVKKALNNKEGSDIYKFYAPSPYVFGVSLNNFDIEPSNTETILLQPNLPRGTSIRQVGKGISSIMWSMGWSYEKPVSIESGTDVAGPAYTDKTLPYTQSTIFGNGQPIHNNTIYKAKIKPLRAKQVNSAFSSQNYIQQFSDYPILNWDSDDPQRGWSVSILKTDGTWDVVTSEIPYEKSIKFHPNMIDPGKVPGYVRSSDGFLRIKVAFYDGIPYGIGYPKSDTHADYYLLDYLPQKPQIAFSKVMPQITASDNYLADIKVAFKNVEGTERILVEQLDEGARVPYTYYVDDVKDGYFIATVDKDYTTKFKLRAQNKNGETYSEQITVPPLNKRTYTLTASVLGKYLNFTFTDNYGAINLEKKATLCIITDLSNPLIQYKNFATNNQLYIGAIKRGSYSVQVQDNDLRIYIVKFII